jgi:hypothetical protein
MQTERQTDKLAHRRDIHGWIHKRTDRQREVKTDGWTDKQINEKTNKKTDVRWTERDRWKDGRADRHTIIKTDRQTDR